MRAPRRGRHYRYDIAEVELALYPELAEPVGQLTRPAPGSES